MEPDPHAGPSELEFQEFIENQKRYFGAKCDAGEGDACLELVRLLWTADKDDAAAFGVLTRACDKMKHGESCYFAGLLECEPRARAAALPPAHRPPRGLPVARHADEGRGVTKDVPAAAARFERACQQGVGDACEALAATCLQASGRTRDVARGMQLMREACDAGSSRACFLLGHLRNVGAAADLKVPQDRDDAFHLLDKACAMGNPAACHNLSVMFFRGDGVPRDKDKFLHYSRRKIDILDARTAEAQEKAAKMAFAERGE